MSADKVIRSTYSIEKLMEKTGSIYKLVILAAKRALEISEGSPRLVETGAKDKPAVIALREITEGKVGMKLRKAKDAGK